MISVLRVESQRAKQKGPNTGFQVDLCDGHLLNREIASRITVRLGYYKCQCSKAVYAVRGITNTLTVLVILFP